MLSIQSLGLMDTRLSMTKELISLKGMLLTTQQGQSTSTIFNSSFTQSQRWSNFFTQSHTDLYAPSQKNHSALTLNKITIKNLVSRWGSCSTKGNLNFNCLLMLTPDYVIDYIVVHELCHLREMNHSEKFWAEVEKIMPDYQRAELWLKQNGGNLISRMRG